MGDLKLLLKIKNPDEACERWVHLCYVDSDVFTEFSKLPLHDMPLNSILSGWCKEDFDVDLPLQTTEELATFRNLIKEQYKTKYPELFRESETDRQGWTRIWVTNKMKESIENGKVSE